LSDTIGETPFDITRRLFKAAPFIERLGVELEAVSAGYCQTSLAVRPDHLQQNGVVHAGVIATLADHTAGGAAASVLGAGAYPLTAEFKINLLRPAKSDRLACRARVLKAGRTLVVAESDVVCADGAGEVLVAKAIVTLAVVANDRSERA